MWNLYSVRFSLVTQQCLTLWPHGLQYARLPCPLPTPGAYSNSCPSSLWCHPTISSSVVLFSSCLQSFPVSGSFPISQLFRSGGQSIGASASASVFPMNSQDWLLLGLTGLISLKSKGLSRVFSSTTVQSTLFMGPLGDFLLSSSGMNDCPLFFLLPLETTSFFLAVILHLQYANTQNYPRFFVTKWLFLMPIHVVLITIV